MSKDLLEKRLAEISHPANVAADKTASLRIIDSFLAKQSGQDALKEAITIVKPFFFAVFEERLQREAGLVLASFGTSENSSMVLEHYLYNELHPGRLQESEALQKLEHYHGERDRVAYLERSDPTNRPEFAYRELLSMLGVSSDSANPSLSLAEREEKLTEDTRNQLKGARDWIDCAESLDRAIDVEHARQRD